MHRVGSVQILDIVRVWDQVYIIGSSGVLDVSCLFGTSRSNYTRFPQSMSCIFRSLATPCRNLHNHLEIEHQSRAVATAVDAKNRAQTRSCKCYNSATIAQVLQAAAANTTTSTAPLPVQAY